MEKWAGPSGSAVVANPVEEPADSTALGVLESEVVELEILEQPAVEREIAALVVVRSEVESLAVAQPSLHLGRNSAHSEDTKGVVQADDPERDFCLSSEDK